MREDSENAADKYERDPNGDHGKMAEYGLEGVEANELVLVIRGNDEEDNARNESGQVTERTGDIFSQTHRGRTRWRRCVSGAGADGSGSRASSACGPSSGGWTGCCHIRPAVLAKHAVDLSTTVWTKCHENPPMRSLVAES